jgi:cytochrome b561
MKDLKNKLSPITIGLHWIIALVVMALMCLGWYMSEFQTYDLYDIHKSIGVLIFILILLRVVWRLKQGFPEPLSQTKKIELALAKIVHWVLLIGTLLFPISGMITSGAGGHDVAIFGLEFLPENPDPETGRAVVRSEFLAQLGEAVHGALMWIFIVAIALHIAGALKHHLKYKDDTLRRMLGKNSNG